MSAPTLLDKWYGILATSCGNDNWDSYGGKAIEPAALDALGSFAVVPCSSGGLQLEVHRDGYDIEIGIDPEGKIENVLVCHEQRRKVV